MRIKLQSKLKGKKEKKEKKEMSEVIMASARLNILACVRVSMSRLSVWIELRDFDQQQLRTFFLCRIRFDISDLFIKPAVVWLSVLVHTCSIRHYYSISLSSNQCFFSHTFPARALHMV